MRSGPTPLNLGNPTVFGAGVDLLGRAIVIFSGGSAGAVEGVWIDTNGMVKGGVFTIFSNFQPGVSTWFETSPLIGGGLALRRMDAPAGGLDNRRTSQWLAVLPSGEMRTDPVPDWLAQRPNTNMALARNRLAYAFLPWTADLSSCNQQVEVTAPSGVSCGKVDFPVDGNACHGRELRLGLDGTVMQMLPSDRETTRPGTVVSTCTLRYWPAALR